MNSESIAALPSGFYESLYTPADNMVSDFRRQYGQRHSTNPTRRSPEMMHHPSPPFRDENGRGGSGNDGDGDNEDDDDDNGGNDDDGDEEDAQSILSFSSSASKDEYAMQNTQRFFQTLGYGTNGKNTTADEPPNPITYRSFPLSATEDTPFDEPLVPWDKIFTGEEICRYFDPDIALTFDDAKTLYELVPSKADLAAKYTASSRPTSRSLSARTTRAAPATAQQAPPPPPPQQQQQQQQQQASSTELPWPYNTPVVLPANLAHYYNLSAETYAFGELVDYIASLTRAPDKMETARWLQYQLVAPPAPAAL